MVSCGSNPNSVYEETISKQLLRGSDTKENLNFKIVELTKQGTITAADSIAYLTDEFRKDQQLFINRLELAIKMSEKLQGNTKRQNEIEKYSADIATMNRQIDSLKNVAPDNLNGYDSKNPDDVLALIIRCKYSLVPPGGTTVEETFDFYLSPDGTQYCGKTRAK